MRVSDAARDNALASPAAELTILGINYAPEPTGIVSPAVFSCAAGMLRASRSRRTTTAVWVQDLDSIDMTETVRVADQRRRS